jgi:hypothetical protein
MQICLDDIEYKIIFDLVGGHKNESYTSKFNRAK